MKCPICNKEITGKYWTKDGVMYHKGCLSWGFVPTHMKTNDGKVIPIELVRLNVKSARVKVNGKVIRVAKAKNKLRRFRDEM